MSYPKIPLAQSVLSICNQKNLKTIVISPGSRNAPLTIGFASDSSFKTYSIADERCAAFFALGIAQQTQQPVALVCTSGSALLNYYPAVAEAFYSQIPLVVISADRPSEKIDIGDGQTIRQQNVYANHILYSANLTEAANASNDGLICEAIDTAVLKRGPVHINVPFEEPLYDVVDTMEVKPVITNLPVPAVALPPMDSFVKNWNAASRKLILIGVEQTAVLPATLLDQLAQDPAVVILTEVTSNLHHPAIIHSIDTLITSFTEADFEAFKPDLLITFGGMVVSKRIKKFLRTYKAAAHWHIDPLRAYDTFGILSAHIETPVSTFFQALLPLVTPVTSSYHSKAQRWFQERLQKQEVFMKNVPYSDLKVYQHLLSQLPLNSVLQISNSAGIRYAQLFPIDASITVFCNRGTSGIDGCTSTAAGAAVGAQKPTVLITGDISFFYDSNALWNNYLPEDFKIVVMNNGGGGIFRILPGHRETPVFNTYFETSHQLNASHLAAMYGFEYEGVSDFETLESTYKNFLNSPKKGILEVFTPTSINEKMLKDFFVNIG